MIDKVDNSGGPTMGQGIRMNDIQLNQFESAKSQNIRSDA